LLLQGMAPWRHPFQCHPLSQLASGWGLASSVVLALTLSAGKPYLPETNQHVNPGTFIRVLYLVYRQSYSMQIKTVIKGRIKSGQTVTPATLLTAYLEQGTPTPHLSASAIYLQFSSRHTGVPTGDLGGSTYPTPKFRSFEKAEPNSQFRGICVRNNLNRIRILLICKLSGTPN
jgi:hypothetical protein